MHTTVPDSEYLKYSADGRLQSTKPEAPTSVTTKSIHEQFGTKILSTSQKRAEQTRKSMVPPAILPVNQVLRGPKRLPNSMHRILNKLNGKLASKHYDTYWLQERVNRLHQPVTDKLDKFFDAKMKYAINKYSSQAQRSSIVTNTTTID